MSENWRGAENRRRVECCCLVDLQLLLYCSTDGFKHQTVIDDCIAFKESETSPRLYLRGVFVDGHTISKTSEQAYDRIQ